MTLQRLPACRRHTAGFTLIEVLIVLAVVGILASVAYPSYRAQIDESHRAQARAALLDARGQLERYFTQHNAYTATAAAAEVKTYAGEEAARTRYTIAIEPGPTGIESSYVVTATAVAAHPDAHCGVLSITHMGVKAASGPHGTARCWRQ